MFYKIRKSGLPELFFYYARLRLKAGVATDEGKDQNGM